VIGANHLVAIADTRSLTQEQGTVVTHLLQRLARLCGEDLDVLGGEAVSKRVRLVQGVDHVDWPWSRHDRSAKSLVGIPGSSSSM
jgi:hypothetical protein